MKCDILLKATKVDGIYDSDPKKNKNAKKLYNLSYDYVINNNLKIMDTASISLAKENKIPILFFQFKNIIHSKILLMAKVILLYSVMSDRI